MQPLAMHCYCNPKFAQAAVIGMSLIGSRIIKWCITIVCATLCSPHLLRKVGEQLTSGDLTLRQALADQRVAEAWRGRLDTRDAVCLPFRSAWSAKWWNLQRAILHVKARRFRPLGQALGT